MPDACFGPLGKVVHKRQCCLWCECVDAPRFRVVFAVFGVPRWRRPSTGRIHSSPDYTYCSLYPEVWVMHRAGVPVGYAQRNGTKELFFLMILRRFTSGSRSGTSARARSGETCCGTACRTQDTGVRTRWNSESHRLRDTPHTEHMHLSLECKAIKYFKPTRVPTRASTHGVPFPVGWRRDS